MLRGVKPIQSELGEAYQQVQMYLEQGRFVLFSGTPCQVDGLYRFLGEHPENLLTCDFACGGVASPGVWERFVESMNYVKRHRAVEVRFCEKMKGEKDRRFRVRFEGGGTFDAPLGKSQMGRGIARRLFLRPACYRCAYANTNRSADLTMGALWDLPKESCPREQKDGASLLLINTVKGAHIFDRLPLKREGWTLEEAAADNAALRGAAVQPPDRQKFFEELERLPFRKVCDRFLSLRPYQGQQGDKWAALKEKLWKKR